LRPFKIAEVKLPITKVNDTVAEDKNFQNRIVYLRVNKIKKEVWSSLSSWVTLFLLRITSAAWLT